MNHDPHPAAAAGSRRAARPGRALNWLVLAALLLTIPAFYLEMMSPAPALIAGALYVLAAVTTAVALWRSRQLAAQHAGRQHARWP